MCVCVCVSVCLCVSVECVTRLYEREREKESGSNQGTLTKGESLSTVDLLVLISFYQLLLKLKALFTLLQNELP